MNFFQFLFGFKDEEKRKDLLLKAEEDFQFLFGFKLRHGTARHGHGRGGFQFLFGFKISGMDMSGSQNPNSSFNSSSDSRGNKKFNYRYFA